MGIKKIDRAALRALSALALDALNKALAPHGVTAKTGRCLFSNGSTGTLKFELVAEGADPERERFEQCAHLYGLQPSDYRRQFESNGVQYILTNIEPGRSKFPFVAQRIATGGLFKFPERLIRLAMAPEVTEEAQA